jgi:hypothetical protein
VAREKRLEMTAVMTLDSHLSGGLRPFRPLNTMTLGVFHAFNRLNRGSTPLHG